MELSQTSITHFDKRLSRISTCTESADSIVPDSYPDIGRIVCAYGTAAIKDQTPQSGRLLVSGIVQTIVLYEPESGGALRRLTVPVSFAHIEECDGLDAEAICIVSCQAASIEATPVNSRKVNVSVQLCFEAEGYCQTTCQVTEQVDLPQVELLRTSRSVTLIEEVQRCPITVLEDAALPDAAGLYLLHSFCTLKISECRAMNGKVALKGEAVIQCLGLQEDDAVRALSSSTPFTQILEMAGLNEGDMISARLAVNELDCRLELDGLLSYTVSATALVTMRRTRVLQQIDDLYLPGRTLELEEERVTLHSMPPLTPFGAEVSETLQTVQHVSHIVAASAACCGAKCSAEGELQMNAAVQVLYLNDEQQLSALQRVLPLTAPCASLGELSQLELAARATSAGERGILLTIAVSGMAAAEERSVFRQIISAEAGEEKKQKDGVTLVLRYIDEAQSLWEIAKVCGTTMDAIRQANELAADTVSVMDTMLLIPIQA